MTDVAIVTEAVRGEAQKWEKLADDMAPIATAVDNLDLNETAFWIGEPHEINAKIYSAGYNDFQTFMLKSLRAAVVEFEQVAKALKRIADEYDRHDAIVDLNLESIYSAQP